MSAFDGMNLIISYKFMIIACEQYRMVLCVHTILYTVYMYILKIHNKKQPTKIPPVETTKAINTNLCSIRSHITIANVANTNTV